MATNSEFDTMENTSGPFGDSGKTVSACHHCPNAKAVVKFIAGLDIVSS
jgi:hypothetical protein